MSAADFDRTANRLGALALRLTDRMERAVASQGARSLSAATALSAIETFLDGPSIDTLRQVLGLSSSAVVRLVDGLVTDGLVARSKGSDARVTTVALTARGRRVARAIVAARADVLADALRPLSAADRAALEPVLDAVLIGLVQGPRPGPAMCRLCDTQMCGAQRGRPCPITQRALGV
ncbi:MAG: MarR family transcriptional regulator [Mycobacteriales bacterium]